MTMAKPRVLFTADYNWLEIAQKQGLKIDWDSEPGFDAKQLAKIALESEWDVDLELENSELRLAVLTHPRACDTGLHAGDIVLTSGYGGDLAFFRPLLNQKGIGMKSFRIENVFEEFMWEGEAESFKDAVMQMVEDDVTLENADLSYRDLSGINLAGINLRNVNLSGANMEGANVEGANMKGVILMDANLTGVIGLPTVPIIPDLDGQILALITDYDGTVRLGKMRDEEEAAAENRLEMSVWNTCKTTHCRGGWAITLAGDEGNRLRKKYGTCLTAVLLYHAAYPTLPLPDFYATNEEALEDIRQRASHKPN
jgi:uncharacterized protein YjbI with pentapeptide repeats